MRSLSLYFRPPRRRLSLVVFVLCAGLGIVLLMTSQSRDDVIRVERPQDGSTVRPKHDGTSDGDRVHCFHFNSTQRCLGSAELNVLIDAVRLKSPLAPSDDVPEGEHDDIIMEDEDEEFMDPEHQALHRLQMSQNKVQMRSESSKTVFEKAYDTGITKACRDRKYGDLSDWPTASVVIAFCDNELLSDLLHTIHSIVQRSPPEILKEIILIDDNSKKGDLKSVLENYCNSVFPGVVRIIRSKTTLGLIKGRLLGARQSRGEIIVSMDAHMEVQDTWLQALIWEIRQNRKTLATATLDWMMPKTDDVWTYRHGINSFICYFTWDMGFGFGYGRPEVDQVRQVDQTAPLPAPCTVGTIWAIEKAYFTEIGELDEGMQLWGGENLDLPIRAWLFGGRAVQVPCSHAAHLERPHQRDYRKGWDNFYLKNYKRVVEVWFDEYKAHFYNVKPEMKNVNVGDLSDRFAVKKRALHDMKWFLSNVYPELGISDNDTFGHVWLKNVGMGNCIHRIANDPLMTWQCMGQMLKEGIFLTTDGYIRTDTQTWHARDKKRGSQILPEGATGTFRQNWLSKWVHWKKGPMMLYEEDNGGIRKNLCMEALSNRTVSLQICDPANMAQRWEWHTYTDDYAELIEKGTSSRFNTQYHKTILSVMEKWSHSQSTLYTKPPVVAVPNRGD